MKMICYQKNYNDVWRIREEIKMMLSLKIRFLINSAYSKVL